MTLIELSKLAGVSTATVSRVFNQKELHKVSPETRKRIEALMKAHNYHPNANAKRLISGHSNLLGFQVQGLRSPIVNSAALEQFVRSAANSNYGVLTGLLSDRDDPTRGDEYSIQYMLEQGVEGIVWQPSNAPLLNKEKIMHILDRIAAQNVKIVWYSKDVGLGQPLVASDERMIGHLAAEHLLQKGCENFYFIGGSDTHTYLRLEGFETALEQAGAPAPTKFLGTKYLDPLPQSFKDVIDEKAGFFSCNHRIGMLLELERRRKNIATCQVCAYGDRDLAEQFFSPLKLFCPDTKAIGQACFESIKALIDGKSVGDVIIPPLIHDPTEGY